MALRREPSEVNPRALSRSRREAEEMTSSRDGLAQPERRLASRRDRRNDAALSWKRGHGARESSAPRVARPFASLAAQSVWGAAPRWGRQMGDGRKFGLVGHDFARKDSVARVIGAERHSVDGYSFGVASSNAPFGRIPESHEVM